MRYSRRMPRLIRIALVAAIAAIAVLAPAAAHAAPEDCEGLYLARDGRVLFDVEQKYVPPPLRGFQWDCASRLTGEVFDDGVGISSAYNLFFVDATPADYVDIIRSFENAGWIIGPINLVDTGAGQDGTQYDSAGLAELGDTVQWATSRFSNANNGRDIISITYTDGIRFDNDSSLNTGSIIIELLLNESFDATGIADPSVLSTLRTIDQALPTPTQAAVIGGSAVMLTLVIGYPGSLLGSVISGRWDRFAKRVRSRVAPGSTGVSERKRWRQPGWLLWPGFVLSAAISGFIDPAFGLNWMSLRVLVSALLGFAVFNFTVWMLTRSVIARLQPDAKPYLKFRWGSLAVVALAVLMGRLLEFNPGVIFGLVAGLAFGVALALSRSAVVILLGSAFGLVASGIAWIGYSLLSPVAADSGNVALVLLSEFLAGVTIKGVASLPLALLPLGTLGGATLMKWKKWVWGVAYAVGIAAFTLVLLGVPQSFKEIPGDFARWISLFIAFGVVAVALWAVDNYLSVRARRRRAERGEPEPEPESELAADVPAD